MHPIIRHLARSASHTLMLWSSLTMPSWAASAPPALPTPDQFFRSSLESEGAERACNAAAVRLEPANLKEANAGTQQALDWLKGWGARHFLFKGPAGCTDWAFVLTRWQITIGLPVTGVMSSAEINSLMAERDRTASDYATAFREAYDARAAYHKQSGQNTASEREAQEQDARALQEVLAHSPKATNKPRPMSEPTALDVLPAAPDMPFNACYAGAQEAMNWARQQELMQRRHLDYDIWRTGLPAHWASLVSSQYPELGAWIRAHGAAKCSARAALRYWLKVIGDPSSIDDPHSTAQSVVILQAAAMKFASLRAEYQKQQDTERQAYEATVSRQAAQEDALVRNIDFDDVSVGARRSDLASRLPLTLCQDDGDVTRCNANANPCGPSKDALDKVRNGWTPDKREIERAKESLDRCEFAYAKSAAGRSSVLFAGQAIKQAALRFERGILVEMELNGLTDPETVRRLLTRRHGAAQTSHEKRILPTSKYSFEPVTDPMGKTKWVHRHETVPFEDTVFHHTWAGKGFVIELTRSSLTMLKTAAR